MIKFPLALALGAYFGAVFIYGAEVAQDALSDITSVSPAAVIFGGASFAVVALLIRTGFRMQSGAETRLNTYMDELKEENEKLDAQIEKLQSENTELKVLITELRAHSKYPRETDQGEGNEADSE